MKKTTIPAGISWQKLEAILRSPQLWVVAGMFAICIFLHYFTPQERFLPLVSWPLSRHTMERIIFLLPIAAAAFAFGRSGGVVALLLAVLIMLPRVFLLSPNPVDAMFETLGIGTIGYVIIWMIDIQEREKRLRQRAVEELQTLNTISATLCQSLDLDAMLTSALGKVLDVVRNLEPKGAIFLLDPWRQILRLRVHQGMAPDLVPEDAEVPLGECLCGAAASSGEVLIVADALKDPRHTRCLDPVPHSHVCIPLRSRDRLLGVIDLYLKDPRPVDVIDRQLFASIGRQIGVAVENARLCENLRFFIRQITKAQEDERGRIARELHDETAQGLVDLSRRLDALDSSGEELTEQMSNQLDDLQHRIEDLLQGLRRFSRDLRPSVLDDLGLLPALEGLIADIREYGIEPVLQTRGEPRRLSPDAELALFRIVQEGLNNAKRHSGASQVTIEVQFREDSVRLKIHDDGEGFTLRGRMSDLVAMGRYGLVGIDERTQLLGGQFTLETEVGEGTLLVVNVPA
jgi:signal transduction histidine kinase